MKIKEKTMEELELFEAASKDLFDTMQRFKDNLSVQFPLLDSDNWQYDCLKTGSILADWVKLKEILIMRIWEDMSSQQVPL